MKQKRDHKAFAETVARRLVQSCDTLSFLGGTLETLPGGMLETFIAPRLTTANGTIVDVDALDAPQTRVVIVGDPGSGKSTLLQYLSCKRAEVLLSNKETSKTPLFFVAHHLATTEITDNLLDAIGRELNATLGLEITPTELAALVSDNEVVFYIDGLDEIIDGNVRLRFAIALSDLVRRFPQVSLLISTRPSALSVPLDGFAYLHLEPFDTAQVKHLTQLLSREAPERAAYFLEVVSAHSSLFALTGNPLFLRLLWQIFLVKGRLPTNRASLYSDFSDYLLSTWDAAKSLPHSATVSLRDKVNLLGAVAIKMTRDKAVFISSQSLTETALGMFDISSSSEAQGLLEEIILRTGMLVERSRGVYSFSHKSFLEYYTASAINDEPALVVDFIRDRDLHEVVVMACGMMRDVAPVIEAAIEKREVLLAAKCISNGRTRNRRIADYVISNLLNEVEEPFVKLLASFLERRPNFSASADEHLSLLNLWDRALDPSLTSQQKGVQFEEFASAFFGKLFKIVDRDLNTENGEIDLVLELTKGEPFWADFGGEALVECKNWNSNVPLHDVGAFANKVTTTGRIKLAFFVSVTGFTEDALRTLKNYASSPERALVVPISGARIKTALIRKDEFEDFFKEVIREIKYLRKY